MKLLPLLSIAIVILFGGSTVAGAAPVADSHTLFLNDCLPNGCVIHVGKTNATTDTSAIPQATSTVTAFNQGATVWANVVSCLKGVMAPFDLTLTEQRPATGPYFELIIAGTAANVQATGTLSLADISCTKVGTCAPYISNEIAFTFANDPFLNNKPNDICATAAQAIAASWALDRVVDPSDVMTLNPYAGVRSFHDNEACGGDCAGGLSPFGSACTGSNGSTATHTCFGSNGPIQNEVQTLLALFGPAPAGADGGVDAAADAASDKTGQNDTGASDAVAEATGPGSDSAADAMSSDVAFSDTAVMSSDAGQDAVGSSPCAVNADCAVGRYCDTTSKQCTFDCRVSADCAFGGTCNSLGMCIAKPASGGGCGCRVANGTGTAPSATLGLLIALAALRTSSRRRRKRR